MPSVQMVSIQADVDEVQKALKGTAKSMKSIKKQALGAAGRGAAKTIKKAITSTTTKRTGELSKAYGYKVKKDGSSVSVWPKDKAVQANNHLVLAKAAVLSYGYNAGDGRKGPHVTARDFVQAGQTYVESGGYEAEFQKIVDKELKKYWG